MGNPRGGCCRLPSFVYGPLSVVMDLWCRPIVARWCRLWTSPCCSSSPVVWHGAQGECAVATPVVAVADRLVFHLFDLLRECSCSGLGDRSATMGFLSLWHVLACPFCSSYHSGPSSSKLQSTL